MHEDGRHPPSRRSRRASLGRRDKVQLVEHANVERRPPPAQRTVEGLVERPPLRLDSVVAPAPPLGGAISERLHEHRAAAPLVRLARPSSSRERLKARLVAAEVEPIDALDDFVRRKGQRAYRVRASIRDDVVGLQHKYDLMKQMVEGRVQHYGAREKIGRR